LQWDLPSQIGNSSVVHEFTWHPHGKKINKLPHIKKLLK
jgi:hypothetical protein